MSRQFGLQWNHLLRFFAKLHGEAHDFEDKKKTKPLHVFWCCWTEKTRSLEVWFLWGYRSSYSSLVFIVCHAVFNTAEELSFRVNVVDNTAIRSSSCIRENWTFVLKEMVQWWAHSETGRKACMQGLGTELSLMLTLC